MTTKSEQQVFTLSTHITTEWNKRRVNSIKTQLTIICTASKTTSFGFNNLIERLNTKVFLFYSFSFIKSCQKITNTWFILAKSHYTIFAIFLNWQHFQVFIYCYTLHLNTIGMYKANSEFTKISHYAWDINVLGYVLYMFISYYMTKI